MFYLDTSVLVGALTQEERTSEIQTWLSENEAARLFYSDWVTTEFSAALSVKVRLGTVSPQHRIRAMALYSQTVASTCERVEVSARHFKHAARLAQAYETGIRAGDALHAAICLLEPGLRLCTLDRRLNKAGLALGIETLLL